MAVSLIRRPVLVKPVGDARGVYEMTREYCPTGCGCRLVVNSTLTWCSGVKCAYVKELAGSKVLSRVSSRVELPAPVRQSGNAGLLGRGAVTPLRRRNATGGRT
jgi:hypothetical protein